MRELEVHNRGEKEKGLKLVKESCSLLCLVGQDEVLNEMNHSLSGNKKGLHTENRP